MSHFPVLMEFAPVDNEFNFLPLTHNGCVCVCVCLWLSAKCIFFLHSSLTLFLSLIIAVNYIGNQEDRKSCSFEIQVNTFIHAYYSRFLFRCRKLCKVCIHAPKNTCNILLYNVSRERPSFVMCTLFFHVCVFCFRIIIHKMEWTVNTSWLYIDQVAKLLALYLFSLLCCCCCSFSLY